MEFRTLASSRKKMQKETAHNKRFLCASSLLSTQVSYAAHFNSFHFPHSFLGGEVFFLGLVWGVGIRKHE